MLGSVVGDRALEQFDRDAVRAFQVAGAAAGVNAFRDRDRLREGDAAALGKPGKDGVDVGHSKMHRTRLWISQRQRLQFGDVVADKFDDVAPCVLVETYLPHHTGWLMT